MSKGTFFILFIFLSSTVFANNDLNSKPSSPIENGTYIKLGAFIPQSGYGWDSETYNQITAANDVDMEAGMFIDIGSYFYFKKSDSSKFGLGINVGWLEFGWTSKTFQNNFAIAHLNLNLLKVGPQVTMALGKKMGADVFFQARPGFIATGSGMADDLNYASGFGINWGTGINVRYGVLMVGFEYVFGNIGTSEVDNDSLIQENDVKLNTENIRFSLGFKF